VQAEQGELAVAVVGPAAALAISPAPLVSLSRIWWASSQFARRVIASFLPTGSAWAKAMIISDAE
jgi:hypothetical protein